MSRREYNDRAISPQFDSDDIRQRIKHRIRLRIPTDMEAFFRYKDTFLPSRLVNLSRGGLFMSSKVLLSEGSRITLYLPNLGSDFGELFETQGEVVWATRGIPRSGLPRGMGIRFRAVRGIAAEQLDSYIVESLQKRLEK
jgi:c-di-GMP-binding flagellar brake protein YcgR